MKPVPGWPRISAAVFYDDPLAAIDWLVKAFAFEVQMKIVEGGKLMHSELRWGDGMVMVGDAATRPWQKSPRGAGGCTQSLFLYVDGIDAHFARAKAAGATVVREPEVTDYGPEHWADKGYECVDPEGHHWWFAERIRSA